MRRALLVVVLLLAVPATASAATVRAKNIRSPTKLITCFAVVFGGKGIECHADYLEPIGDLDPYLALRPRGKSVYGERGDFPGDPDSPFVTLQYGDTWKRKGIRCKMRESGLTCRNRSDHGFHLARGDVRRF